jgi:glycosyltransferase involved in cell wall biosynthesis
MSDRVTVIVPTLLHPRRRALIRRAIDSVLQQTDVDARVLLVANGSGPDAPDFAELGGVRLLRLPEPNLPAALSAGRRAVDSEFFCILDDDDHLLAGALKTRLNLLRAHPESDLVVTNGIVHGPVGERPFVPDMAAFGDDPLRALGDRNWLSPGSALIRTNRVGTELFDAIPRYLEWTYLAVRLATSHRILFSNATTFVYSEDSPDRVSTSEAYLLGQPAALARVLSLEMPAHLRRKLERNRSMAFHSIADRRLLRGEWAGAWRAHLASLAGRGGLRFLPFTRKLVGLP